MQQQQPSQTALGAALHRAAHQILDGGFIFSDPLAARILGSDAEAAVRSAPDDPSRRRLRFFIAVRTRFAEDALAAAVERGVRQVVVLGAGLDTYAYRNSSAETLRIFEVDHPATQAWKRQRLGEAAIPIPRHLTFVPLDFERENPADGLTAVGFEPAHRTFFTWLGVVPYLSQQAVFETLRFIVRLSGGAQVVFDYANPPDSSTNPDQYTAACEALGARVASMGEAFRCFFETDELRAKLTALGFSDIEDLGPALIRERYFTGRTSSSGDRGGHIVRAATL